MRPTCSTAQTRVLHVYPTMSSSAQTGSSSPETTWAKISMATWYLINVTYIDLSFSNVTAISDDVMSDLVKNKKYLSIARNSLKYVPRAIEGAGNGTELWIGGNPYECNCDMLWMRDWLVSTTVVRDRDDAVCNTGNMKGRCTINNLRQAQLSAKRIYESIGGSKRGGC